MEKYRVFKAHSSEFSDSVAFLAGESLRFARRETDCLGWLWCTKASGESRWVPENWLEIRKNRCTMKRDYNSRELLVQAGAILTGELIESGWLLAHTSEGIRGWIPLENVEKLE